MGDPAEPWQAAMRQGDVEAAWAISDAVLAARDPAERDNPALPYHQRWVWDGRPFAGRRVLVRCYHGLGDTLQFIRFLPALRARVASLSLEVQPELAPLLAGMPGVDRLIGFDPAAPIPPSECDLEVMELSHALRLPPAAAPPPYVHAPPAPVPADSVGLCWRSGGWNASRSMPDLVAAGMIGGRIALSLQPGPAPPGMSLANPEGCPAAIADTAGVIAAMPLVITVDTMVAHLAGALGRPTWLMLPHVADWRWGCSEQSAWYPSIRLYRQPSPGAWDAVAARIAGDLARRSLRP